MKLVSGIVDSGFFAQSALSAEVATKDSLGRNISETYLTAVDIPESANWNSTYNTVHDNSASWTGGGVTGDFTLVEGNGIQLTDDPIAQTTTISVSGDYATKDWVTGQGYLTAETDWTNTITAASANAYNEATAAIPTGLATEDWVTGQGYITNDAITGKQDITGMTAYATVESLTAKQDAGDYLSATDSANFLLTSDSGNFYPMNENPSGYLTAHQSLTDYQTTADMVNYQTIAGMTAYQEAGDYYSASNPSGFITGVDLTPYQLTADMTAYQPTGDYLTTADSANFYTTANESGFISEVPAGTMNESAFSYDASDNITAYNGSAFKAGDEFPQSATEAIETVTANSADWNGTTETVSSNSGVWGGSALPISAGPGIKFEMVDNTLVASTDETVLYTGNTGVTAFTASEPFTNFKEVAFYVSPNDTLPAAKVVIPIVGYNTSAFALTYHSIWAGFNGGIQISTEYNNTGMSAFELISGAWFGWATDAAKTGTYYEACIYKIIGINRIAGE